MARRDFEATIVAKSRALSPEARVAVIDMLCDLLVLAEANAEESRRRNKWMMHAYWKVVSVYCKHFRRLIVRSAR